MRLSPVFCRQHLDRMFKKHWKIQGQCVANETGAASEMKARGIPVYLPHEILQEKKEFRRVEIVGFTPLPVPLDQNHPLYNQRPCHMYRDHNVLLEGLDQAKVITKTVEKQGLLESLLDDDQVVDPNLDKLVRRSILSSHVFDAAQEKLPHQKDPSRPAWNFPRLLGIPDHRRNRLLTSQLVQICESALGNVGHRYLIRDGSVTVPIEKDGDLIQLELTADLLLMSSEPLPTSTEDTKDISLPDLGPMKFNVTLEKANFYETKDVYPDVGNDTMTAHTAIFHYNETQVKNIYETPVTESQFLGRTLMKSFAVAAAQARQTFGKSVRDLPEPITLQSIHTDGRHFHFLVFQLNTLDISGTEGTKNLMWTSPRIPLYTSCSYDGGRPQLMDYNPDVFKSLLAFYRNGMDV